ncbi:hypothetical protein B0H12DRAFT_586429 [Mycena haematopus]|nr:hypothetical protein B0H12DRAFT_586429 [Mycena haematopus]
MFQRIRLSYLCTWFYSFFSSPRKTLGVMRRPNLRPSLMRRLNDVGGIRECVSRRSAHLGLHPSQIKLIAYIAQLG